MFATALVKCCEIDRGTYIDRGRPVWYLEKATNEKQL